MKVKIFLAFVLFPFLVQAQLFSERSVVASCGSSVASGNLHIEYTMGELSVQTLSGADLVLCQGFQQSEGIGTGIPANPETESISVYPNPVSNRLTVSFDSGTETKWRCFVKNVTGKTMPGSYHQLILNQKNQHFIDFTNYPKGIYFIHLLPENEQYMLVYKTIKAN